MKNYILTVLLFLVYSLGVSQVSVVDYTIMGNESNEYANDVDTLDGFIYLSGNTNECGNNDGFVLKYKDDSLYKRKLIGNYNVDIIESIESRVDGKLFLAGYTDENNDYDVQLAKLDTQLNVLIEKIIEYPNWNFCYDISLNNNGVVGVGKTHNGVDYDAFVFKIDDNLDTVWTSVISKSNDQQLNNVISYNDSIYIAAGYSEIDGAGKEIYILSLNVNNGDTLWSKTIGGVNDDFCNSIIKTQDGGLVGFGTTSSYVSTSEDYMLFKVDSSGSFIWSELHQVQNGIGTYNDRGIDLIEFQNGDLAVASYTESYGGPGVKSTMIMFTNSLGHWLNGYIYDGGHDDVPSAMIRVNDTTLYVVGMANSQTHGYSDAYLMRLRSINVHNTQNTLLKSIRQNCFSEVENSSVMNDEFQIFPNPISNQFSISNLKDVPTKVTIYNLIGKIVYNINSSQGNAFNIPSMIKNGNYILKIETKESEVYKSIIILR